MTYILGVLSDIKDVIKTLSSVCQKIEEKHAKWFQEACQTDFYHLINEVEV